MKKNVMKAVVAALAMLTILQIVTDRTSALETTEYENMKTSEHVDLEKDGYRITFIEEISCIDNGKSVVDCCAPGIPQEDYVFYYDQKVHDPEILIYQYQGQEDDSLETRTANRISSEYYDVMVPEGRWDLGYYTYEITFKGKYAKYGTIKKEMVIVSKARVSEVIAEELDRKIKVSWIPYDRTYAGREVTGYSVCYKKYSDMKKQGFMTFEKHKKIAGTNRSTFTITGLKTSTKYFIMVRPYFEINHRKIYGRWSKIITATTK